MTKGLDDRLGDARGVLDRIQAALGRNPGRLSPDVEDAFRKVVDYRSDIDHCREMLGARTVAFQLMDTLEAKADSDDLVPFGGSRVRYQHVRFVGAQAYLTITWALSDRISAMVGRVLCTPEAGFNGASPAQLVSHFVQKERTKKTAGALFESIRHAFGWPIGLSYAIRNHFVHDGGQTAGVDFFEGPSAASAFRISADGWDRVEKRAVEIYGVERTLHRVGAGWPSTPRDDLRVVLAVCEREVDDALGVLLGSACNALRSHVGFMLGED
jgi:hypothetical protein